MPKVSGASAISERWIGLSASTPTIELKPLDSTMALARPEQRQQDRGDLATHVIRDDSDFESTQDALRRIAMGALDRDNESTGHNAV